MKVIYQLDQGVVVIHPAGVIPIEEVARKDVPFGAPYLIVEDEAIPTDRTFRAAWEADFSNPDGYGIGAQRWFIEQAQADLAEIAGRVAPVAPEVIVADAFAATPFPDDMPMADRLVRYDAYVAGVDEYNAQQAKQHQKLLATFQSQQQADANRCNALIEQMKAEVLKIEGVTL